MQVVGRRMRLEAEEALGRVEMALLAGLQTVGRIDARARVVDALDRVVAVAVETFGGVSEAERIDLAVVGPLVGCQLLLMATAAVLGDQELGLVEEGVLNVVRGVAVRADRRLRIGLQQRQLAVYRGLVFGELRL